MHPETAPAEARFAGSGVSLHGLDWGGPANATPMILLHGVGGNAWVWDALAPRLRAALGDAYHIVGIDQRGGGDSDKPPSGYGAEDFAQDVLAVQDAMGGRPMVLVGHSRGGWLATYIAGRWPDRVSQVVLIDPARMHFASTQDADDFYAPVRAALGPFPTRAAALAAARGRETQAVWGPERERTVLFGLQAAADGSLIGKMPPWVLDQMRRARETSDSLGPLLEHVTMPVLLMVATRASEARQRQKLEYGERLPNVRVERLDGTHYLHLDQPRLVTDLIVEFLPHSVQTS